MPLPASGNSISLSQVNTELGLSATATISMNDTAVRNLFGRAGSGTTISMSDGFGKANAWSGTITTNQQELNLRTWAINNGWNGSSAAIITVASGVYIWSNSTATPALTVNGSWPGGITLINNGFIMGRGGNGGWNQTTAATAGGPAISLGVSVTINNQSGYIGGGGGGGAGGVNNSSYTGGGGAGGGEGGRFTGFPNNFAAGGGVGVSGSNGTTSPAVAGGGGRIMPGTGGAAVSRTGSGSPYGGDIFVAGNGGGAGGSGSVYVRDNTNGNTATSGAGGGAGGTGGNGFSVNVAGAGGGGGGWGAAGGNGSAGGVGTGAAGGRAVTLNGFSVTWVGGTASSSRSYGAVS